MPRPKIDCDFYRAEMRTRACMFNLFEKTELECSEMDISTMFNTTELRDGIFTRNNPMCGK